MPDKKSANTVLSEALAYFMGAYWSNSSLARASGLAEGTIRNYRDPEKRTAGKSGKAPSAKLTELEKLADAMGLRIRDLVEDESEVERAAIYRKRAAEYYEAHGRLPPWAPGPEDDGIPPITGKGLGVVAAASGHARPSPAPSAPQGKSAGPGRAGPSGSSVRKPQT